jgi:hypothetical protein
MDMTKSYSMTLYWMRTEVKCSRLGLNHINEHRFLGEGYWSSPNMSSF